MCACLCSTLPDNWVGTENIAAARWGDLMSLNDYSNVSIPSFCSWYLCEVDLITCKSVGCLNCALMNNVQLSRSPIIGTNGTPYYFRSRGVHLHNQLLHRHTVPRRIRVSRWRHERHRCHVRCQPVQRCWCVGVQQLQRQSGVEPGQLVVCGPEPNSNCFVVPIIVDVGIGVCVSDSVQVD